MAAISSLLSDSEYDGIVLAGWPNDTRFRRLLELELAPDIRTLTYQFERKWFDRYRARTRLRSRSERLSAELRAGILQVTPSQLDGETPRDPFPGADEAPASEITSPVFIFEARLARRHSANSPALLDSSQELRSARLVRFKGGCHAFLTEWAELPVLNEVIEYGERQGAKISRKPVGKFVPGDFLLFRAAGDKEFIRLIAEESMGAEEYSRERRIAERWKAALRALG